MPDDPKDPVKDEKYYVAKYGNYMGGGRYADAQLAGKVLPDSKRPYKDIIQQYSKQYNIPPELLFSSLNEEGVRNLAKGDEYSGDDKYPVSGYVHFGLDTFGDAYPDLVKKGYLPADMDFKPTLGSNEKNQKVHTADFKDVGDAVQASAAMMKNISDNVDSYAQKKGYNLSPESKNFFMLAGFNGGLGNAQKMLDSYAQKGILQNDAYLKQRPSSYAGIYDNTMRRIVPARAYTDDGLFSQQPTQPTQPQQQGQPYYDFNGKVIAYTSPDGIVQANQ